MKIKLHTFQVATGILCLHFYFSEVHWRWTTTWTKWLLFLNSNGSIKQTQTVIVAVWMYHNTGEHATKITGEWRKVKRENERFCNHYIWIFDFSAHYLVRDNQREQFLEYFYLTHALYFPTVSLCYMQSLQSSTAEIVLYGITLFFGFSFSVSDLFFLFFSLSLFLFFNSPSLTPFPFLLNPSTFPFPFQTCWSVFLLVWIFLLHA